MTLYLRYLMKATTNKCLSCGNDIDDLIHEGIEYKASILTRCHLCRMENYPKQTLPYRQYAKYWLKISKRERRNGGIIKEC
jgi:hypothetical protein